MSAHPKVQETPPLVDQRAFRNALGRFVSGVTVATAVEADGTYHGLTVSSFTSLSLDPPLVLFCLGRRSKSLAAFTEGPGFAVSILGAHQEAVANAFAYGPRRWEDLSLEFWETGAPLIRGAVAQLDCGREAVHEGGDHVILVGRVLRTAVSEIGQPLVYHRGRYTRIDHHSDLPA